MVAWGLLRILTHLLWGLGNCILLFPLIGEARKKRRIVAWSRQLLAICRIQVELVDAGGAQQAAQLQGGEMVICNHLSWIDIFVINTLAPCHFVAKADIRDWPLIGKLCEAAGTVFIARGNRRDVRRIFESMVERIHAGDRVAFFPEGTTAVQGQVLPFHANLFEAAITAEVPLQPLALRYLNQHGQYEHAVDFVGETTFAQSVISILRARGARAQLMILPLVSTEGAHRRELAEQTRQMIVAGLGLQAAPAEPELATHSRAEKAEVSLPSQ